jgi:uncharacterized protein CbrC (UPF0167 family)
MLFHACLRRGLAATVPLVLAACAALSPSQPTPLLNYQPESFGSGAFSRHFSASPGRTCEAARRALLGNGYVVTNATTEQVTARKYFQPDAVHHVQLEFKVVCASQVGDGDASVAFANSVKEQYVMRKVKDSASVGVGGIGSLSLPVEGGLDALVKVSSETVVDSPLYERFFSQVNAYLEKAVEPQPPAPQPKVESGAPDAAVVPGLAASKPEPAASAAVDGAGKN